jgi:nucleotide-binding universal stress UspA family protein
MDEPFYRRIAVASAFSPRFEQVLAEAKRVRERLGSELNLIYVGKKNAETVARFQTAIAEIGLPADSIIHYQQGTPAEAILEVLRAQGVELIVAGALEKEVVLRPFLGNVARRLVREATCSVMLFTRPEREPKPFRQIVFFVPEFSEHAREALRRTIALAEKENTESLYVIRIYTTFDAARATLRANLTEAGEAPDSAELPPARTLEQEEEALEEFIDSAGETKIEVEARCIQGNTGFAASDFVQAVEADLLVVPVAPGGDSSELPPHIAWVTDVIPCNLWVIR